MDNSVKPPESLFGLISPLVQMPLEDSDSSPAQAPEPELPMASQDEAYQRSEACETNEACPSCGVAVPADESICPECGCDIMMAKLLGTSTVEEPAPSSVWQPEREVEAEPELEIEPQAEIEPQPEAGSEPELEPEPAGEPEPAEASSEDFAATFASAEDPESESEFDFGSTLGVVEQEDAPAARPAPRPPAKLPPKQPDPKPAKTPAAVSPARTVRPPSKKRGSGIRVMILGGLGGVVLVALGFAVWAAFPFFLSVFSSKPSAMATLVLDWPAKERNMGRVYIDLARVELPNIGPIEYSVKPGDHRIILNREGYEPIRFDVTLGDGERFSYKPEWKFVFVQETAPAPAATPAAEVKPAPPAAASANPAPNKQGQEPPAPAAKPAGEVKPAPPAAASANPAPSKPGQEPAAVGASGTKK
jgi:hypothetical protein